MSTWFKNYQFLYALLLIFNSAQAAVDRRQALFDKKHTYIENGVITGGVVNTSGSSLLDVRRFYAQKDKIERVVIELGDDKGKPLLGKVSYFQVMMDKDLQRVVIELPNMLGSNINAEKIRKMFAGSPVVKSAKINFDPVDTNITIQLQLKSAVQVEAFQLSAKDKSGRVVVDLKNKG